MCRIHNDGVANRNGVRVPVRCDTTDLRKVREAATREHDFVWVGLHKPDEDELTRGEEVYGPHPLALEEPCVAHQRPNL